MTTADCSAAPARGGVFRADIQGLRALAVVLVVVFHTGLALPGGFVGVDVFFVLSGFLIIGLLDREAERSGRINLGDFFARRARRLLPALALVTTVTVLAAAILVEFGAPLRAVTRTAVGASLFVANAVLYREADYFAPAAERNPLLHTWSLSIEEQFYVVLPLLFTLTAVLVRGRDAGPARRNAWIIVLALATLVSFVINVFLVDLGGSLTGFDEPVMLAFYAPVTRAWQFSAGGLLALAQASGWRSNKPSAPVLRALGLALILVSAVLLDPASAFPGVRALLPVAGTMLALTPHAGYETGRASDPAAAVLTARPAVVIGDLSYSLYLWHWPAIVLVRAAVGTSLVGTVIALLGAVGLSVLSTRALEERFRRDASIIGRRALRLLLVSVAIPSTIALAVSMANARVAAQYDLGLDDRSWSRSGCLVSREATEQWSAERCSRGRLDLTSDHVDVLLIGDSHADALADGVLAATERLGLSIGVWTIGGQPPHGDERRVAEYLRLTEATRPSIVILTARSAAYVEGDLVQRWRPDAHEAARISGQRVERLWAESLRSTVETLRALGPHVVWVLSVPEFPFEAGEATERGPTLLLRERGFRSISLEELSRQRGEVTIAESQVLRSLEGVTVIDPARSLCRPDCANGELGRFFYYDANHMNPRGSLLLSDAFEDAFAVAIVGSGPDG